ncbi:hypothetical protein PDE_09582 [Penicillium oxalicum 114-2]|uniref:SAC3/GANP/THP3 conserved domain-containing protein n=1 Tax=Penicillium oxalicum (strain 114-2 / CGMCC 5302) TaxID=933388 RepID=S8B6R8_PENO1|nr:hypothetical protein PDE_09582 [Penicillium oxalicum 114-2]
MADAATQRGRGGVRGGMRGGSTDRGNKSSAATRGRGGRGRANTGLVNTRGRAAGTSARGASHIARSATISSASSGVSSSPFAQLNQSKQSRTASPFSNATSGLRQPRKESPLAAAAAADNVFNPSAAQRASKQIPNGHAHGALANQKKPEIASVSGSFQDRYEQLKLDRAKQRQQAIQDGLMADPNQPTSLKKAIRPVGTCESMCPEFERVERIVQKMVDRSEKQFDPATNAMQNVEGKMLKRFRRSAAGYDEQLPSDIRTPKTLLQATNYLIRYIVGSNEPLGIVHKFVWDRTRSIRNDFSVQQVTHEADVKVAVLCLERIARFHILSLHLLSSPANEEQFDRHQEREQLNNTMLSLMYYYDDNRGRVFFPNEEEFRAYYIIFSIHDQRPDLEARVQKWPAALLNSPRVQVALELYAAACNTWEYQGTLDSRRPNAIAQGFYSRFFHIIDSRSVSYLMACVAEIYFTHVRQTTIRAIWKAYCRVPVSQQHKNEEWTLEQLTKVLYFDDDEQTLKFCEEQDLQFSENSNGEKYLNWGSRPVDSVGFSPSSEHAFSETYVESKRAGRNLVSVILGMSVREAASIGMIDKSVIPDRMQTNAEESQVSGEKRMVLGDKDDIIPAPATQSVPSPFGGNAVASTFPMKDNPNPFQQQQPPSLAFETPAQVPTTTSQSGPSTAPNPFSGMFSGTGTGNQLKPASVVPFPAEEPSTTSPFSFGKPSQTTQTAAIATSSDSLKLESDTELTAISAPNPFPSAFSGNTKDKTLSASSPFSFPKPAGMADMSGSTSTTSLFKPTEMVGSGASQTVFPPPSVPKADQALQPSAASQATTPFSFPSTNVTSPKENTAGNLPNPFAASLSSFSSSKQPLLSSNTNTGFNVPTSQDHPVGPEDSVISESTQTSTSQSQSGPSPLLNGTPVFPSTVPSPQPSSGGVAPINPSHLFAPKGVVPSNVSAPAESTKPSFPEQVAQTSVFEISSSQSTKETPEESSKSSALVSEPGLDKASKPKKVPTLFGPSAEASTFVSSQMQKPLFPPSSTVSTTVSAGHAKDSDLSPNPNMFRMKAAENASRMAVPQEPALTVSQLDHSAVSLASAQSSISSEGSQWRPPQTKEEEVALFKRIMKRAEEKALRKEDKRKRKRVLEEQALADTLREERRKASKSASPDEQESATKKFSLAESSIKALPTLPCLEKTKRLLESKPSVDPELELSKKRQREIDEDELLLNSARIVAEQLRTGPKIFDEMSPQSLADYNAYHAYWEQRSKRPFSYSHSASPSATPIAQSASPPQFPRHPYEVAYAPDKSTGLGRTMSRTEYRIRMTGGHGLAYKPLDFSRSRTSEGQRLKSQEKESGKSRFAMSG